MGAVIPLAVAAADALRDTGADDVGEFKARSTSRLIAILPSPSILGAAEGAALGAEAFGVAGAAV